MRLDELELSGLSVIDLHRTVGCPHVATQGLAPGRVKLWHAWSFPALFGMVLAAGISLRLFLPAGFTGTGFDENLYRTYVMMLDRTGIQHYPDLIAGFIADQLDPRHQAILPPTRMVYIVGGYLYHQLFGLAPLPALHALSCHFSILTLLIAAVFCWRLTRNRAFTTAVTALMACAPTQIHLGQHALIDGFFGFWALLAIWLLWENLRERSNAWWLIAYGAALAVMVMTKENAAFVVAAIMGIFATNHWFGFGRVTRSLVLTTFAGTLAGLIVVVLAAGGVEQYALVFALLKQKVPILAYTIKTGGGPWHRYLIDLILVSPIVVMLAASSVLQARRNNMRGHTYLAAFFCLSYGVLTIFPDGMNLRYMAMLDMPLRFLAGCQLFALSGKWGRHRNLLLAGAVLALCAYDLRQHNILFVKGGLYELVTEGLVRAQGIMR
jgi:hypothetical protein